MGMPPPGMPPAGGDPQSMLMAALMGGNMDTLGGDLMPQIAGDFPLQPPAPPLDDGMLQGGFPAMNMMMGQGGMAPPDDGSGMLAAGLQNQAPGMPPDQMQGMLQQMRLAPQ